MKAIAVCLVLLFIGIGGIFTSVDVHAAQDPLWSDGRAVILKQVPHVTSQERWCTTYTQEVFVAEYQATRNACMYGDERLKIGNFYGPVGNEALVQFPFSSEVHVLDGICDGIVCLYSPDTDVLVTRQPVGNQLGWGLVIYKNVTSRIHQEGSLATFVRYVFDATHPDYIMSNDEGIAIVTPAFAISDNGKWVVAELRDKGVALVDTETLTTRHVGHNRYRYGFGTDPELQLDVSNNGKAIAATGLNAGFDVIDVTSGCGQDLVGDLLFRQETVRCQSSAINIESLVPGFLRAERPRFLGEGGELELNLSAVGIGAYKMTFGINELVVTPRLNLLSLGDSFSSGEGETDDSYYLSGTNKGVDTCHISKRAYSGLVAVAMGYHEDTAKNIACSGAKITDIVGSRDNYWGQGGRLRNNGLNLSVAGKGAIQEQSVDNFLPGRALQLDFIERYNPETITIGIGGNDAGLMGKLNTCAMPGTCEWATPEGIDKTRKEIRRLSVTLASLFSDITEVAGNSHVLVIGYPNIIDPYGVCDPVTALLFDAAERRFIQQGVSYLNQVVHAVTDNAGFTYVDIEDSLKGRQLCSAASPKAVNGLRVGDDIAITSALPMLKIIGAETFHPTPTGHVLIAQKVRDAYFDSTETTTHGELTIDSPEYWTTEGSLASKDAYLADFTRPTVMLEGTASITIPDGALQQGSNVVVQIRSSPMELATLVVNEHGGLTGTVTIPESVGEGFHTLHLYGTNNEGLYIDMYQFITVTREEVGDTPIADIFSDVGSALSVYAKVEKAATDQEGIAQNNELLEVGVLGAQVLGSAVTLDSKNNLARSQEIALPATSAAVWILVSIGLIVLGICTLFIIIISRKWAKHGS